MLRSHFSASPDATWRAGQLLGELVEADDVIGLVGDLGAGKTLFVQGLAAGLEVPAGVRVTSPTFAIINEYRAGRLPLVHVDLYRIDAEAELEHIGLDEMLESGGVAAVEWCDRFAVLPEDHLLVTIEIRSGTQRVLQAQGTGERSVHLAERWAQSLGD